MNKKTLLVTIFSILLPAISLAGSFNGWIYQNPYPTSNTLLAVKFVTPQKGWIAGEKGTILYTEDGGDTWEAQLSGTGHDIRSLAFVNEKQGWAVGNDGTIIHTEDGGKTWVSQYEAKTPLHKIFFINEKEGWAVGDEGTVLHTTDSGNKWEKINIGTYRSIASIYFITPQTGWMLAGDEVYRTRDGGKNWEESKIDVKIKRHGVGSSKIIREEEIASDWWQGDIYFTDEKNGWAVFGFWYMSHTSDGGKTWKTDETGFSVGHISFDDEKHGCVAGATIRCTEDGGKTWNERSGLKPEGSHILLALWGISFSGQKVGFTVGKDGKIFKSEDGGKSWNMKSRGYGSFVYFLDSQTGWNTMYDYKRNRDSIVKTDDGGKTWVVQKEFENSVIIRFFFINPTTGWAVGKERGHDSGGGFIRSLFILHTNDGGKTWVTQFKEIPKTAAEKDIFNGLFDVFFINSEVGWAVGSKGLILHTKDGGEHWERQKSGTKFRLRGVQFVDDKRGWVIGENVSSERGSTAIILHTTNGGKDWKIQWKKKTDWLGLHELQFIDNNTGWVAGAIHEFSGEGLLVNTTDGGKTWSEKEIIDPEQMFFIDKNRGVILTYGKYDFLTRDGGKIWEKRLKLIHRYPWHISEVFKEKDK